VPAPAPCHELLLPELVAFLHSGVSTIVGTSSGTLAPALTRAFATRVAPDGRTLDVFVGRVQSATALANVVPGRPIALTIGSPTDYRAVQIKGTVAGRQDPDDGDAAWLQRYFGLLQAALDQIGIPPALSKSLRCADYVRITVLPVVMFRQTPGPGAGSLLAEGPPWT
jgi:hypothetical protein